jgi:hypothetical protein
MLDDEVTFFILTKCWTNARSNKLTVGNPFDTYEMADVDSPAIHRQRTGLLARTVCTIANGPVVCSVDETMDQLPRGP